MSTVTEATVSDAPLCVQKERIVEQIEVQQAGDLPWVAWWPQYPGTKCKSLFVEPETGESLRLAYIPSEFRVPEHTRHHHGPTREFVWVVFGDIPYVEYDAPDAAPRPFTFRQGMLLDRPPRSIHGMSVDPVSELGSLVLEWTTGPNDFNVIPFDGEPEPAGDEPFASPWVADSSAVGWEPHPTVDGWRTKTLSSGGAEPVPGYHPVVLVHVPAAWSPGPDGASFPLQGSGRPWCYVLDGTARASFAVEGGRPEEVSLRPGAWVRWPSGGSLTFAEAWTEDLGLTFLCAGGHLVGPPS